MWEEATAHVDGRVGLSGDRRLALNLAANEVGVPWLLKVANQPDVPASGVAVGNGHGWRNDGAAEGDGRRCRARTSPRMAKSSDRSTRT